MPASEVNNEGKVISTPAVEPAKPIETKVETPKVEVKAEPTEKNKPEVRVEQKGEVHVIDTKKGKKEEPPVETPPVATPENVVKEIGENEVLTFIKNKFGKEVSSLDELVKEPENPEPLPAEVESFLKYKKETGRGVQDYLKLQQDFTKVPEDDLLKEYYLQKEEGLEPDEIELILEDEFGYDEDYADEKEIKRKQIAKKKKVAEALKHFESQKEQYKTPIVSVENLDPSEVDEFKLYKEQLKLVKQNEEKIKVQSMHFEQETQKVFSNEFKGFEFKIKTEGGEKSVIVPETNAAEVMKFQSNPRNIIQKFLDKETGLLVDAKGYHKALAAANNPDKYAEFFYELGRAEAIEMLAKDDKNINMSIKNMPQNVGQGGMKVKAVETPQGGGSFKFAAPKR